MEEQQNIWTWARLSSAQWRLGYATLFYTDPMKFRLLRIATKQLGGSKTFLQQFPFLLAFIPMAHITKIHFSQFLRPSRLL
jgi:hypothetical protein